MAGNGSPGDGVRINFGGRERTLRYDFNALCQMEEVGRINPLDPRLWERPSPRALRALIWAGLLHEDPNLKLEHVGMFLDAADFKTVAAAAGEAFAQAFPSAQAADARPTEAPAAG